MNPRRRAAGRLGGALLSLSFFAACGGVESSGTGGAGGTGSSSAAFACDNRGSESRCFDYWSDATKSDVQSSCDGAVIDGPCPRDKAVGTCVVTAENEPFKGKQLTAVYYADGTKVWTQADAEADCTSIGGAFAAP